MSVAVTTISERAPLMAGADLSAGRPSAVSQQLFSRGEEDRAVALRPCNFAADVGFDDERFDVEGEGWVVHVISFLS